MVGSGFFKIAADNQCLRVPPYIARKRLLLLVKHTPYDVVLNVAAVHDGDDDGDFHGPAL